MLDFELSDEQRALQDAMKKCLEPFASRHEELRRLVQVEKKFPQELWDAICETGLLGSMVPPEHGGNGAGLLAMALGIEALSTQGFGNALLILTAMDAACIARNGSEVLKKRYLPKMATGELKFCFALTEPDAGSNTFRLRTLAKKVSESEYSISGEKVFITGADRADKMLLVCRTTSREDAEARGLPKAFGLALFVVDCKAKGVTLKPIPTRGIEGMTQFMVHLEDCRVPASDMVGEPDMGGMVLFNTLNPERILAAASTCGIAQHMLDKAVKYANERAVFKERPIGAYQSISHPLAKVRIDLDAVRLLTYRAAWAFDKGMNPNQVGTYANMAKYQGSELAIAAVDRAIQTLGGYGFSEEYGVIYYYDTVRLLRTAPITSELILNFIAEHELGLPRSY